MVTIKEASNIVIREALIKGGGAREKDIAVIRLSLACVGPQIGMDLGKVQHVNNNQHAVSVLGILGLHRPPFRIIDAGILNSSVSRRVLDFGLI
jgi:hypothetical protein